MKKSLALVLFSTLALSYANSAFADKAAAPASAPVEVASTPAAKTVEGPAVESLDGAWFSETYNENTYKAVTENQAEYIKAKGAGDWVRAEAFSPFTYVKGWMHLSQARELKYEGLKNKDVDTLEKASTLYVEAKAIGEKAQSVVDGRGDAETQKSVEAGKLIVEQADANITGIAAAIDLIKNPPVAKKRRHKKEVAE